MLIVSGTPAIRVGLAAMVGGAAADIPNPQPNNGTATVEMSRILVVQDAVGTAAEAGRVLAAHRPALSVLVADPPLPDVSLTEALQRLTAEHLTTGTLVLLQQPDPRTVRRACRAGARGVHDMSISEEGLHAALTRINDGDVAIQPSLVRYLLEQDTPEGDEGGRGGATISARELTVLQLMARGYSSKQMAPLLGSTAKAVDLIVERAARRLNAANRTEAVATAMRRGLLT